ncbi:MAG: hypothetical protein K2W78_15185 [Xanthobacteraceae bacterium]|nr:hypothetical protein [Xanthobacteraceae bacterium]
MLNFAKVISPVAVLSMLCFLSDTANSQDAGQEYRARYVISGFLLRASKACKLDDRAAIAAAVSLVSGREMKAFSEAYPDTIKEWMMKGASDFNERVMRFGLDPACDFASGVMSKTNELANANAQ